jgi:hypothetical protein
MVSEMGLFDISKLLAFPLKLFPSPTEWKGEFEQYFCFHLLSILIMGCKCKSGNKSVAIGGKEF